MKPLSLGRSLATLALFWAAPAFFAPSAHADEAVEIAPIEIRGHKERRSDHESTESVTVIESGSLVDAGSTNPLSYLSGAANVQVNKNGESFSIRGINNTGATGFQKDNLASLIVDDIFQTELAISAGGFSSWDLSTIEVHRGPQSTTQGVNSLAGSLVLFHEDPSSSNEGFVRGGVGNLGWRELGATTNNRITERLSTRISLFRIASDGHITNVATGNEKAARRENDGADVKAAYRVSESSHVKLTGRYLKSDRGGSYVQGANPFDDQVNEDVDLSVLAESRQGALRYDTDLSGSLKNSLILTYTGSTQGSVSDADGTPQATAGTRYENNSDRYASIENLLHFDADRFRNMFGVHSHAFDLDDRHEMNLLFPVGAGATTPVAVRQTVDRERTSLALFDSATFDLDARNTLQLGLRFETVKSRYTTNIDAQRTQDLGGAGNTAVDTVLASMSGAYGGENVNSVWLPKVAFTHLIGEHQLGASFRQGFRTGGVDINRKRATAVEYDPEFTDNFELSYKRKQGPLSLEANAFYTRWISQQVQVKLSNDFYDTQVVNAANSELWGAEAQARFVFSVNRFDAGLGYVDTAFRDFTSGGKDFSGNEFPFAAHWTSRLTYGRQWSDLISSTLQTRYIGRSFSDAENSRTSSEQILFDLAIQSVVSDYMIEVFVNNLFDRRFLIYDGRPTTQTAYQTAYHQTNSPREFGIRASYFW